MDVLYFLSTFFGPFEHALQFQRSLGVAEFLLWKDAPRVPEAEDCNRRQHRQTLQHIERPPMGEWVPVNSKRKFDQAIDRPYLPEPCQLEELCKLERATIVGSFQELT